MARVAAARDGFAIRGIAPPELRGAPDDHKVAFWSFVLVETLREKDRELAAGLDRDGRPLRPIEAATRRHRRSMMTPTGKGDPSAPPLMPGRALSRTRSLLTGKAFPDHCELYWRYDPFTYDSWAAVLRHQARRGRDVFGLSNPGLGRVAARSWAHFRRWRAGRVAEVPRPPAPAPAGPVPRVGTTSMKYATPGIGAVPGRGAAATGGLPWGEWLAYLRRPAPPPAAEAARARPFNRLLRMMFGS